MSDKMVIDHEAVSEAVEQIEAVAEDLDAAAVAVCAESAESVSPIPVGEFAFRPALNTAESWWYSRIVDHRDHLVDLAQFMATNAAVAAQHDESSESDMVELDEELQVDVEEYTTGTTTRPPAPSVPPTTRTRCRPTGIRWRSNEQPDLEYVLPHGLRRA